ncbi:hypothetical protein F4604DRAFT_1924344 [Suillus subluteus]|nr:hypothetical protein F4604DRAFT_1924344 [Suillus subluteus]
MTLPKSHKLPPVLLVSIHPLSPVIQSCKLPPVLLVSIHPLSPDLTFKLPPRVPAAVPVSRPHSQPTRVSTSQHHERSSQPVAQSITSRVDELALVDVRSRIMHIIDIIGSSDEEDSPIQHLTWSQHPPAQSCLLTWSAQCAAAQPATPGGTSWIVIPPGSPPNLQLNNPVPPSTPPPLYYTNPDITSFGFPHHVVSYLRNLDTNPRMLCKINSARDYDITVWKDMFVQAGLSVEQARVLRANFLEALPNETRSIMRVVTGLSEACNMGSGTDFSLTDIDSESGIDSN